MNSIILWMLCGISLIIFAHMADEHIDHLSQKIIRLEEDLFACRGDEAKPVGSVKWKPTTSCNWNGFDDECRGEK